MEESGALGIGRPAVLAPILESPRNALFPRAPTGSLGCHWHSNTLQRAQSGPWGAKTRESSPGSSAGDCMVADKARFCCDFPRNVVEDVAHARRPAQWARRWPAARSRDAATQHKSDRKKHQLFDRFMHSCVQMGTVCKKNARSQIDVLCSGPAADPDPCPAAFLLAPVPSPSRRASQLRDEPDADDERVICLCPRASAHPWPSVLLRARLTRAQTPARVEGTASRQASEAASSASTAKKKERGTSGTGKPTRDKRPELRLGRLLALSPWPWRLFFSPSLPCSPRGAFLQPTLPQKQPA